MSRTPFYKLRRDALLDAGVTSRQDSHWKQAELFRPELAEEDGRREGRYTERDVEMLKWLKHFLDDSDPRETGLGIPIATMQALLYRFKQTLTVTHFHHYVLIDVVNRQLTRAHEIVVGYFARASQDVVRDWALTLSLWYFKKLRETTPYHEAYQSERDRFLTDIQVTDYQARIEIGETDEGDEVAGFNPWIPGENHPYTSEDYDEWMITASKLKEQRRQRLAEIEFELIDDDGESGKYFREAFAQRRREALERRQALRPR